MTPWPDRSPGPAPQAVDRDLVEDLARAALERVAPEELVVFDDTAEEYFADPEAVLNPVRRDEAVGFGLDLALLTPYLLAVATPVLTFLLQTVADATKQEATPVVAGWVRRLLRRPDPEADRDPAEDAPALSRDQADQVRAVALARATDLGLPEPQARLLADSLVGGLAVSD